MKILQIFFTAFFTAFKFLDDKKLFSYQSKKKTKQQNKPNKLKKGIIV